MELDDEELKATKGINNMEIEKAIEELENRLNICKEHMINTSKLLSIQLQATETLIAHYKELDYRFDNLAKKYNDLLKKYNKAVNYMAIKEGKDFEEIDKMLGE